MFSFFCRKHKTVIKNSFEVLHLKFVFCRLAWIHYWTHLQSRAVFNLLGEPPSHHWGASQLGEGRHNSGDTHWGNHLIPPQRGGAMPFCEVPQEVCLMSRSIEPSVQVYGLHDIKTVMPSTGFTCLHISTSSLDMCCAYWVTSFHVHLEANKGY